MSIHDDIDWYSEITEFLESGMSITAFSRKKGYTYDVMKYHLYRDVRYNGRNSRWGVKREPVADSDNCFLPVVAVPAGEADEITVNGYRIRVDDSTSSESLRTVLKALRDV